ncbi:hypothetical protein WSS15_27360 [Acetobacter pasteurianus]|uniref:hypothetical protein n=1 Tax=Acetobacter pasteurianus TaxID=438 RepID=UPI0022C08B26|nr:hypothetical protein [Acetobacter pasteurianus]GLH30086.1 hypothetical protein WSS15_27360 [Acetobacter pasteurianus]
MTSAGEIEGDYAWHKLTVEVSAGVKIRGEYSVRPDPSYFPEGLTLVVQLLDWPNNTSRMCFSSGDPEEYARSLIVKSFERGKEVYLSNNPDKTEENLLNSLRGR